MNLYLRMIYVFLLTLFRERLDIANPVSKLRLRVLPNDIDINMHMNNGRYLTICDLNRVDLFIRTGLMKAMIKRNWIPLIAEHTMVYKKPLDLFASFEVALEVTRNDEKYFYMNHVFTSNGRVMAEGTSRGCVYARGVGVVSPAEAIAAVEEDRCK
jgi:acyl-CoA thioesterase FadM